jgi:hypothetical protein
MLPRPRIHLPLWTVPVIVAALYAGRSILHGSWLPDIPMDAVIGVMVVVVMFTVARLRAMESGQDEPAGDGESAGHEPTESPR